MVGVFEPEMIPGPDHVYVTGDDVEVDTTDTEVTAQVIVPVLAKTAVGVLVSDTTANVAGGILLHPLAGSVTVIE
jgi:hypothetical protein